MRLLVLVTLCVLATSASASIFSTALNFVDSLFTNYEEAPYTVINIYEAGYEERTYPARRWVCTDRVESTVNDQNTDSFMKLFRYISGTNNRQQEIPMTVPVSIEVTPSNSNYRMRMCFFIGQDYQDNPPLPAEDGVFIEDRQEITIFTRRIGGWPSSSDYAQERQTLEAMIKADGNNIVSDDEYRTSYNDPFTIFNRRNELWLIKA